MAFGHEKLREELGGYWVSQFDTDPDSDTDSDSDSDSDSDTD
jgi:hypothetical protein